MPCSHLQGPSFLKSIGALEVFPQRRAVIAYGNGTAQFSTSAKRCLTVQFWGMLGLKRDFLKAQERMREKGMDKVLPVFRIQMLEGVLKGHSLPIPAPKSSQETPPAPPSQGVLEAIQRAREAQARAQKI